MNVLWVIPAVIVFFVILIVPHELGHFTAAKLLQVKVNEFAFGMGPAIFQKQGKETLYSVRAFPIGGYCALEGENEDTGDPRAFNSKPGWVRIVILAAGVSMNILTAVIIMTSIFMYSGYATLTIEKVQDGSPAEMAGILPGDRVTALEKAETDAAGTGGARIEINDWEELSRENTESKDGYFIYVVRDGAEMKLKVTPEEKDGRYLIGITPVISHDLIRSVRNGAVSSVKMAGMILDSFRMLFTGKVGMDEVSGPVGIVSAVNESASHGLIYYLFFTAMMCVNLAVVNILPLPALDGGRILFVIIRKVTGKMISDELEGRIHMIGMAVLLAFIMVITFKDVGRLFI